MRQSYSPIRYCDSGTIVSAPMPVAEKAMPIATESLSRYQRVSKPEAGTIPVRPTPMPIITPTKR